MTVKKQKTLKKIIRFSMVLLPFIFNLHVFLAFSVKTILKYSKLNCYVVSKPDRTSFVKQQTWPQLNFVKALSFLWKLHYAVLFSFVEVKKVPLQFFPYWLQKAISVSVLHWVRFYFEWNSANLNLYAKYISLNWTQPAE